MPEWVTTCDARPDWLNPDEADDDPEHYCFVILWSAAEPERIGELAVVGTHEHELILGRGGATASDRGERLVFCRQRPRNVSPMPPLGGEGLSRRQCLVRVERGAVSVQNLGRARMFVDGCPSSTARIQTGQVLTIQDQLILCCTRRRLRQGLRHFEPSRAARFGYADDLGMVGEEPAVWELRDQVAFCAASDRHVLVLGESGSGKELAAQAIHRLSSRGAKPLVARDAATFPHTLIDSELFGNVANYPNPGLPERLGLIGQADGSAILLDEVADLPFELQAHLLRVLDHGGEYQQLGNATTQRSRFRLIAATNRDPTELRSDLLARLTLQIQIPNLMDRRCDIPLLVRHLLQRITESSPELRERYFVSSNAGLQPRVAPELIEALMRHRFRNNVRELEAILWKAVADSPRNFVALGRKLRDELVPDQSATSNTSNEAPRPPSVEPSRQELMDCLTQHQGNVARAAQALGVSSRYALYRLMRKHGISVESRGS